MRLNVEQQKQLCILAVENGLDLSTKNVSLCNLSNHRYSSVKPDRGFQVHADKWSRIYKDLEDAADKFVELVNATTSKRTSV